MKTATRVLMLILMLAFVASMGLTGCRDPGPAEEAGREVDEAVEEARDAVEDIGDEAEEALEEIEEEG
jgi:hypothetical protein